MNRDYIRQALEVQQGENAADDAPPDLEAVARELGMSDADMAQVEQVAKEHLERGSGYCRHHQWDEAIAELSTAAALRPTDVGTLHLLAEAYAGRWRGGSKKLSDRAEAERVAKRCIELKPDYEPPFALLEELDAKPEPAAVIAPVSERVARQTKIIPAILGSVMVAVAGIVIVVIMSGSPSRGKSSGGGSAVAGRPIPIRLNAPPEFAGMTLQLDRSRIIPDEVICCVQGDVTPAGDAAASLASIPLKLDLIDSSGKVAATDQFTAWPCSKHPGAFNFHRDNPLVPRLKEAVLTVQPIGAQTEDTAR
jgi:hypothetical protein